MKFIASTTLILICSHIFLYAQPDSVNSIEYTPDFKFKEGIYVNFEQVKNNRPIPKSRIISTIEYDDPEFFEKVLSKSSVYFYNDIGNKKELPINSVWGYSRNGFIYIGIEKGYYRITLIGSICHFVATHTTYTNYYSSPYFYDPYMDPFRSSPASYQNSEMRQYLLDFSTGKVFSYDVQSVEVILMHDSELHDEFLSLSRRKKKQFKFVFIRKYNEKNKLYFPNN